MEEDKYRKALEYLIDNRLLVNKYDVIKLVDPGCGCCGGDTDDTPEDIMTTIKEVASEA